MAGVDGGAGKMLGSLRMVGVGHIMHKHPRAALMAAIVLLDALDGSTAQTELVL